MSINNLLVGATAGAISVRLLNNKLNFQIFFQPTCMQFTGSVGRTESALYKVVKRKHVLDKWQVPLLSDAEYKSSK